MTLGRLVRAVTVILGVGLFARCVQTLGTERIHDAVVRVGWGFGAILLISGAREAARAVAWMRTIEGPARLRFTHAFRARLAGEALNTLLPMGMLVGEPAKAAEVGQQVPLSTAFKALIVEFAFYCGSLVPLMAAGSVALLLTARIPVSVDFLTAVALLAATLAIVVTAYLRAPTHIRFPNVITRAVGSLRDLGDVVSGFMSRHPERLWAIATCEAAFQVLAIAEVYVMLRYISPLKPTFASAVVLETVSRVITMVFKILPMRVGVDEAGASLVAARLDLGGATGLTLALVRKMRLLVWSAVGLLLLARHSSAGASARESSLLARLSPVESGN